MVTGSSSSSSSSRSTTSKKNSPSSDFYMQRFNVPFAGQHTGVAVYDLNGDGYLDLLFSSGRHWIDQSYVMMNLGIVDAVDTDPEDNGSSSRKKKPQQQYKFSKEYPIGEPGGYYQVDATTLSFMNDARRRNDNNERRTMMKERVHHTAVLLAGSVCTVGGENEFGGCEFGSMEPAVLLDVSVHGCSVHQPDVECAVEWNEIWREPNAQGNRNGAFAASLGNDVGDPAIVLVGTGGISIFEPKTKKYHNKRGGKEQQPRYSYYDDKEPTLMIAPDDQILAEKDQIARSTGLAVGYLGDYWPGIIVGPRTSRSVYPAPLIAVYKDKTKSNSAVNVNRNSIAINDDTDGNDDDDDTDDDGNRNDDDSSNRGNAAYDWYDFGDARYEGDYRKAPQPSGLVLTDLNGDGYFDIVEASNLNPPDIIDGYGLDQNYYLLDENGYAINNQRPSRIFTSPKGARSVHAGNIYNDSAFPDLAFGDSDGHVILFANLGNAPSMEDDNDENGSVHKKKHEKFLGFEQRDVFQVSNIGCEVRGIKIASLSPCSVSILAAVTCENGEVWGDRQNSNRAIHRIDPTGTSCFVPPPSASAPPLSQAYPGADNHPTMEGSSPAASALGQSASSAPTIRVVPVKALRYQHALIAGFSGALLFWWI
jgi:hypothetical protein